MGKEKTPFYPGDAGGEPYETRAGAEIAILEKEAYAGGGNEGKSMNEANITFYRTDPFISASFFFGQGLNRLFQFRQALCQ